MADLLRHQCFLSQRGLEKFFRRSLFFLIPLSLLLVCQGQEEGPEHLERGFYYWKSEASRLEKEELSALNKLGIDKLFFKFFEVAPDEGFGNKPVSKSSLQLGEKEDAKREREKELFSSHEAPRSYRPSISRTRS